MVCKRCTKCGAFALLFLLVKSFVCPVLTLLSLKQKHKQLVVGFPVLRPRRFGWLYMLIFCRGRWDVQIVKRMRRAFSREIFCFVVFSLLSPSPSWFAKGRTVTTTALLIYTPQVFSELAYFQVAIKLLYSFQLIFERTSSLSSERQSPNRFIKITKQQAHCTFHGSVLTK